MFYLFLLISVVSCARIDGKQEHTKSYVELMESLFIRDTYIENIDRCKIVNNRAEYVKILESVGILKISSDEYHMEHIIDQENTPYSQNKNILGNLVMAKATWNRQVGQLNWDRVEREKRLVYRDIFDKALSAVIECDIPPVVEDKKDIEIYIIILMLLIFSLLVVGIAIVGHFRYKIEELPEDIIENAKNVENLP